MSVKISKMKCHHCGGPHKQSKCGQFIRDSTMAQLLTQRASRSITGNIAAIPKHILRMSVNNLELGMYVSDTYLKPTINTRSKPLNSFTKKQLIDRYYKLAKDYDEQVDKIDKELAFQQEQDVCPICLDSLTDKKLCTSPCGHTFCSDCFIRNITADISANKRASSCPCCRSLVVPLVARVRY